MDISKETYMIIELWWEAAFRRRALSEAEYSPASQPRIGTTHTYNEGTDDDTHGKDDANGDKYDADDDTRDTSDDTGDKDDDTAFTSRS